LQRASLAGSRRRNDETDARGGAAAAVKGVEWEGEIDMRAQGRNCPQARTGLAIEELDIDHAIRLPSPVHLL